MTCMSIYQFMRGDCVTTQKSGFQSIKVPPCAVLHGSLSAEQTAWCEPGALWEIITEIITAVYLSKHHKQITNVFLFVQLNYSFVSAPHQDQHTSRSLCSITCFAHKQRFDPSYLIIAHEIMSNVWKCKISAKCQLFSFRCTRIIISFVLQGRV